MSLTLRVLAPDKSVFDGPADEIILPSTTGLLGVLPGHISMVTALDIGVMRVLTNGNWNSIALMGGFAEVEADDVTVLVNGAELGESINSSSAEAELEKAKTNLSQFEGQEPSTEKLKAQQVLSRARARVQASKSLNP
ncbi:ATP synthase F1 subunit epsilon [Prochlorococcus sp. MIT 1300]|uniref:ATP synthase F1 subunit epsilon n=1 Tax=Prochlorococcus sp. MIT 1300 TaxID=3096218 RepID=UPI002A762094|nr:ATP synthase F1 subunit epsilon [Prochlorococcus sp. MIT 1300]